MIKGGLSKSLRQDRAVWILDVTGVWLFVGKAITLGGTYYFANIVNQSLSRIPTIKLLPRISSVPVQIVLYLLLADLVGYWLHRTFHKIPALWMLHKFHHSATEMGVFTARRDNPLVVPLFILFTGLPVSIFGAPSEVPLWITFFAILHSLIIHSQIPSDWGFFGRWVLVSPYGHTVHHSKASHHLNKNFCFMFPLWDHVFGSYYGGSDEVVAIGVDEPDSGRSLVRALIDDTGSCIGVSLKAALSWYGLSVSPGPRAAPLDRHDGMNI